MPKRQNVRTIKTDDLQGENSYVIMRRMTVGEIRSISSDRPDGATAIEVSAEILSTHVTEWNWVDDDGEPLPSPAGNVEVLNRLTDEEFQFLGEQLMGVQARKN